MSIQTPTTYSPEAVVLIVDGVQIEGLAEEGISIDRPAKSEISEGMDSGATYEFNPSRLVNVTITLRAASLGAKTLEEIRADVEAAIRGANAHPQISLMVYDAINGSEIVSGDAFFLNDPYAQAQMKSGNVVFEMATVNGSKALAANL